MLSKNIDCTWGRKRYMPHKREATKQGFFPFMPPVRYAPPATEHVSLHSKSWIYSVPPSVSYAPPVTNYIL